MLDWIFSRLSVAALDVVMEKVVQPFLQIWLKAKDVDLEKFRATEIGAVQLGAAVLDANVKFASIKSGYALSVLQWWPFRLILFVLLLFCSVRFCLILIDSTYWFIFGCTIDG